MVYIIDGKELKELSDFKHKEDFNIYINKKLKEHFGTIMFKNIGYIPFSLDFEKNIKRLIIKECYLYTDKKIRIQSSDFIDIELINSELSTLDLQNNGVTHIQMKDNSMINVITTLHEHDLNITMGNNTKINRLDCIDTIMHHMTKYKENDRAIIRTLYAHDTLHKKIESDVLSTIYSGDKLEYMYEGMKKQKGE